MDTSLQSQIVRSEVMEDIQELMERSLFETLRVTSLQNSLRILFKLGPSSSLPLSLLDPFQTVEPKESYLMKYPAIEFYYYHWFNSLFVPPVFWLFYSCENQVRQMLQLKVHYLGRFDFQHSQIKSWFLLCYWPSQDVNNINSLSKFCCRLRTSK